ncbi:MAG: methyltransferase domain-containing protein [Alphaproteobacteria bacterium]|nr:methyltransferase domain-containing protein [Alphaproteobacteria bacterium]
MTDKNKDTEQLQFWRGEFGNVYIGRNSANAENLRARVAMWADIMRTVSGAMPKSILEVGSNIGNNLRALHTMSAAKMFALEPNAQARDILLQDKVVEPECALEGTAAGIPLADKSVEMAFTCGVLIHIHPDNLLPSCHEIHRVSSKYIACVEYFSDKPEMIPYRGYNDRLFKRDFGGFWMDNFPDLRVLGTGFLWKRATGLDNLTWWMFEKR